MTFLFLFSLPSDAPLAASDLAHASCCTRLLWTSRAACLYTHGSEHFTTKLLLLTIHAPKVRASHKPLNTDFALHVGTVVALFPSKKTWGVPRTGSSMYRCLSGFRALTVHMHNPGRNVALALAVAGLPSALVGRWTAPVSEPHCVRERESDFERLVGQNLWRLEFLVKQVGDFASSGKVDEVPRGEERARLFQGAVAEILLDISGGLATQLILTVVQKFTNGCPRRARTNDGTGGDPVAVVAFFNGLNLFFGCMDNPDVWHEFSVTWSLLGADGSASVITPDDDHHVGFMAEASAGT